MQSSRYYLVSSLPLLRFGKNPAMPTQDFLPECKKWMSPQEYRVLQKADIDSSKVLVDTNPILTQWRMQDSFLRDDLSRARHIAQNTSGEKLPVSMLSVFAQETPLLMEKEFARKQWYVLDELELGHYFDINILIVYFLKLQILERFATFNKDEGMKVFNSACEVVYGQE